MGGWQVMSPSDPHPTSKLTRSTCFLHPSRGLACPNRGTALSTHPTSYKLISWLFTSHFSRLSHGGVTLPITRTTGPYTADRVHTDALKRLTRTNLHGHPHD